MAMTMKKVFLFLMIFFLFPICTNASTSTYLKSFEVLNGSISVPFTNVNNIYTITLEEEATNLQFSYELEDETSTVEVLGNEYILNGENKVQITISSSDNLTHQTYIFHLEKKSAQTTSFQTEQYTALNIPTQKEIPHLAFMVVTACLCIILLLFKFLIYNFVRKKSEKTYN